MPDTTNEAIALARRIVAAVDPNSARLTPHPESIAWPGGTLKLARALLDATSSLSAEKSEVEEWRAWADRVTEDEDPKPLSPDDFRSAQYRAGMEAAAKIGAGSVGQVADTSANAAERIRAAIAALPASSEPVPVAMPELRWEEDITGSAYCLLGEFLVGNVVWVSEAKYEARVPDRDGKWIQLELLSTKPEARAAVEAAVRERLSTIPAKGHDHG